MTRKNTELASNPKPIVHNTFMIERIYPQSPARVFFVYSDQEMARRWRGEGEGFTLDEFKIDLRIGGAEVSRFRFQGGPEIRLDAHFHDIIPDQRIVYAYKMAIGSQPLSVSLATVEFSASGKGTLLKYTEQGVYFDGIDSAKGREEGCRGLLEKLAEELQNSK